jgi:hypothetical protein
MIRILNDFNDREDERTVVLNDARLPPDAMVPGARVFLYEPDQIECEAIVRRGKTWPWVAEMIAGTIRHVGEDGYTNGRGPDGTVGEEEADEKWRAYARASHST